MRNLWVRQIRPAIVLSSFVVFIFLFIGQDASSGRRNDGPLRRSLLSTFDLSGISGGGRIPVEKWGGFRHLLASPGDVVGQVAVPSGVEEFPLGVSSPVINGGEQEQQSSRNESLGLPAPVERMLCENVRAHVGFLDSCTFVRSVPECDSGSLIDYTELFFCTYKDAQGLAYVSLGIWLAILFYVLGNTAADFFCCSIEQLSKLLHLPPTVAGVTLLPLGNGAPDVFASIAAFMGAGQGQVGLNSVLGGATFVSSVVAGSASLVVAASHVTVHLDRRCFLRDVGFFLFTLGVLGTILFHGTISFWGAVGYLSIYAAYAITVAAVEFLKSHGHKLAQWHALQPLLQGQLSSPVSDDDESGFGGPGGPYMELFDTRRGFSSAVETSLPQWAWAPHVAIFSQNSSLAAELERHEVADGRPLWGWSEQQTVRAMKWYHPQVLCSYIVEWPLTLPRRLTIPQVEEARWSKFYAVCSATLAFPLLAGVWDGKDNGPFGSAWIEYIIAGGIGLVLGGLAYFTTKKEHPPRRYLFPWAAGGFVMSIVWFYIVANELVAALVALGVVLEIDAAILGLTVLAWGNSIGDLMSNLALVCHGGDGVQIAFSGCYAGPMFNTLVGIGLSFALASWKTYPAPFVIPQDPTIFFTLAFLVGGLVWAFIVLPSRRMQPTKGLGVGLLALYATFITVRVALALGLSTFLDGMFNLNR